MVFLSSVRLLVNSFLVSWDLQFLFLFRTEAKTKKRIKIQVPSSVGDEKFEF